MASSEQISYMDEDESSSSASVPLTPLQASCFAQQSEPPQRTSVESPGSSCVPKKTSVVMANASATEGGTAVRATLNILPSAVDNSDAESVVDNSLAYPARDQRILNNLDKQTALKVTDESKFFIPHIPDLFYPEKDKSTSRDDSKMSSRNFATFREDSAEDADNAQQGNSRHFPAVDPARPSRPRGSFEPPSVSRSPRVVSESAAAGTHFDQLPRMARSDSISSLASEVSSCAGEVRRRESGGPAGDTREPRLRSSKRRRSSLRPRFKRTFADATLQYIRDRLEGRIFSGWLEERQRLDRVVKLPAQLEGAVEGELWRDVLEVDACEVEMVAQLDAVLASVPGAKEGQKWINIQPPGAVQGYLLWLVLDGEPRPPHHYWFKLHSVTSHPVTGLQLHVSVIRPVGDTDAETPTARTRRLAAAAAVAAGDVSLTLSLAWQQLASSVKKNFSGDLIGQYLVLALHPSSLAYAIRVVVLAVVSLVVGSLHCVREVARFFLLFMREAGHLIDRATPAFQVIVTFVEKIIGGFFVLLAMVYKDVRRPASPPPPPPVPAIAPQLRPPPRAIQGRRYVSANTWQVSHYDT